MSNDLTEDLVTGFTDWKSTFHIFNAIKDTKFYLFSSSKPDGEIIGLNDRTALASSQFDESLPIRIICGGYLSNTTTPAPLIIRQAYVGQNQFNVFVVDWSIGSRNINYPKVALQYTRDVASVLAKFVEFLVKNGATYDNIYLIGHSLGAHISGMAGKYTKEKVNTIFGLDPGGPLFNGNPHRIGAGDGKYVEIIHTNGNNLGFYGVLGDADFYVNGGKKQPGCSSAKNPNICNHNRVAAYFAESICADENQFLAVRCSEYNISKGNCKSHEFVATMGSDPSNGKGKLRGTFYLKTNSAYPYGLGYNL